MGPLLAIHALQVSTEALELVKDTDENSEDQVATTAVISLAIDIKKNHIRIGGNGPLDITKQHRILDFAIEEFDRFFATAIVGVIVITQKIRQNFKKMRLT